MLQKDIKIVDLKKSKWDRSKSDPKRGVYSFEKKVYISKTPTDRKNLPDHFLVWVHYDERENYARVGEFRAIYQAETVKVGDEEYWPEGLTPSVTGEYIFQDTILMKIPIQVWLEKIYHDQKKFDKAPEEMMKAFTAEARKYGAEVIVK